MCNCLGFTKEHNKCLIYKETQVDIAWCPVYHAGLLSTSGQVQFLCQVQFLMWGEKKKKKKKAGYDNVALVS